ncbi:ent-kaurene oxidase [Fusarium heterosporum]|uniref:Ent-kaurene oxidase n=1 Tax=Fusarium heterosporum TaxID=42747 RepID=A0A8H5TW16_FUSHE|nr:ent-kaurene oxidase [Fusarium heterosporum]
MDPLSALGIAAAVVQFVDFGQRLLSETWQVYRSASGKDLELYELSLISKDLEQISQSIRNAIDGQKSGALDGSHDADSLLLHVCGECDAIAGEINKVLPQIDESFQAQLKNGQKVLSPLSPLKAKSISIGDAFRRALKTIWKGTELDDLKSRFVNVRQQVMMAVTMSMWYTSRDNRGWEMQFSKKLDTVIEILHQAVEKTVNLGPGRPIKTKDDSDNLVLNLALEDPNHPRFPKKDVNAAHAGRGDGIGPIEPEAIHSVLKSRVGQEIINRLWNREWKPETSILSSFPQHSPFSREDLTLTIRDDLSFPFMVNREEAIVESFQTTYNWVFSRQPLPSSTGEPMWSSLPKWLESSSQFPYWITGKPGAGKSTVMKHIANHPELDRYLSPWAQGVPIQKTKYYAWKPGMTLGKSEEGLMRALLYQTIRDNPTLAPYICPRRWALFHMLRDLDLKDLPPWSDWELRESFSRLLRISKRKMRLMMFIDGLDEFEVAPLKLCSLIQEIAQHKTIKVCVASRSWPQFSDAFADSRGMQMHLLTHYDIRTYVFGHFKGIRAFQECNSLYQNGGDRLLDQVVSKANGVFLWTAIVTQTIYQSLIEGASLPQLQAILDKMPPEIESLYDAIYLTIPTRLLPEVSVMLQMHLSACPPVDWMTLWISDEARGARVSINIDALDEDQIYRTLKRRLSARTRGLLDAVKSTETVDFLHRTAAEWIKQPKVWKQFQSASPPYFDPYMCLLRAEIIKMENLRSEVFPGSHEFWLRITTSLLYASAVNVEVVPVKILVEAVDQLHQAASGCLSSDLSSLTDTQWPTYQQVDPHSHNYLHNSFHGLTVQFAILPYIHHKLETSSSTFHAVPSKNSKPLLEQAIFGFKRYSTNEIISRTEGLKVATARQLETTEYLLTQGIRQSGIASLIVEAEAFARITGSECDLRYYKDVRTLLQFHKALEDGKRQYVKGKMRKWFH